MNPCLASSSCTSCAPCAKRSGGKQTSSVMSVEPSGRFLPTKPRSPSRTCQASSMASVTLVNSTGLISLAALTSWRTWCCVASSELESSAPISTSKAAALGSRVLVEKCTEPQSVRVPDRVLATHTIHQHRVSQKLSSQLEQALRKLRLCQRKLFFRFGSRCVDYSAGWRYERERGDGMVGIFR